MSDEPKIMVRRNSTSPSHVAEKNSKGPKHTQRCSKCKETVFGILQKIYGRVSKNHKIPLAPTLDAFQSHPFYPALEEILHKLKAYRGYEDFIKTSRFPACDYFVHEPGFIVEFDESQHFTIPRAITLENYPPEMEVGFSVHMWINLCRKLKKKDNDPPYQDEQRAWYDTLRDFVPRIMGYKPTVRLYANERRWCELDPDKLIDVNKFRDIVEKNSQTRRGTRVMTVLLCSNG